MPDVVVRSPLRQGRTHAEPSTGRHQDDARAAPLGGGRGVGAAFSGGFVGAQSLAVSVEQFQVGDQAERAKLGLHEHLQALDGQGPTVEGADRQGQVVR